MPKIPNNIQTTPKINQQPFSQSQTNLKLQTQVLSPIAMKNNSSGANQSRLSHNSSLINDLGNQSSLINQRKSFIGNT